MLIGDERTKLTCDWGVSADKLISTLSGRECAAAIIAMNCIFGIRSYVAKGSNDETAIHAARCIWKNREDWTPEVCASIENYDI